MLIFVFGIGGVIVHKMTIICWAGQSTHSLHNL